MSDQASFDPEVILKTLAKHQVKYVLIGALAARLQGFPRITADADITFRSHVLSALLTITFLGE